jgi:hypothetical protein
VERADEGVGPGAAQLHDPGVEDADQAGVAVPLPRHVLEDVAGLVEHVLDGRHRPATPITLASNHPGVTTAYSVAAVVSTSLRPPSRGWRARRPRVGRCSCRVPSSSAAKLHAVVHHAAGAGHGGAGTRLVVARQRRRRSAAAISGVMAGSGRATRCGGASSSARRAASRRPRGRTRGRAAGQSRGPARRRCGSPAPARASGRPAGSRRRSRRGGGRRCPCPHEAAAVQLGPDGGLTLALLASGSSPRRRTPPWSGWRPWPDPTRRPRRSSCRAVDASYPPADHSSE